MGGGDDPGTSIQARLPESGEMKTPNRKRGKQSGKVESKEVRNAVGCATNYELFDAMCGLI